MPQIELQLSREEMADLNERSSAAALTLRDYLRAELKLPDEESSAQQRRKNQADDFRAKIGRWTT